MDFVADELYNGRRLRALTIVDNLSRQAVAIAVDHRINGEAVVGVIEQLADQGRMPRRIQVDNGSFRDECLNLHWFLALEDARQKIET